MSATLSPASSARRMPVSRKSRGRDLIFAEGPLEERLQASVGDRHGGRALAGILERDDERSTCSRRMARTVPGSPCSAVNWPNWPNAARWVFMGGRALVARPQAEPVGVDRGVDREAGRRRVLFGYDTGRARRSGHRNVSLAARVQRRANSAYFDAVPRSEVIDSGVITRCPSVLVNR